MADHRNQKKDAAPARVAPDAPSIEKSLTGITGFDEISRGGLPHGRTTLIVGGPGTGKTVFALETLVNGAREYGEPGIFVAFEESSQQIVTNASTFGWDLGELSRKRLFFLDARLPSTVVQAGTFDLTALLGALTAKVREMGARRIVIDGIDVLLTVLDDEVAERREMYRLQEWLLSTGLTAVITAKASPEERRGAADRYGFMQFMVDCLVNLEHRLADRVSTRGIQVVKYRGSSFAEGEFPLVIGEQGIEISTFGGATLRYPVFAERVSTGVDRLDRMLGGGYYRGSAVLISGAPGTTKTTLAGAFARAAAARGERTLYVSFDENGPQIVRNLMSVDIDLRAAADDGRLVFHAVRTESRSAEEHLMDVRELIHRHEPANLIVDPISALMKSGGEVAASHAGIRIIDLAKSRGITVLSTSLLGNDVMADDTEATLMQISTIADTWIHLAYLVHGGERNRTLTIVKSRGMRHSNQVRELLLTDQGVTLADVYTAGGNVLVGTARWERERQLQEEQRRARAEAGQRRRRLELAEAEIGARMEALRVELEARRAELATLDEQESARRERWHVGQSELRRRRDADGDDADDRSPDTADGGATGGGGGDRA